MALRGERLEEAKLGVLTGALLATALSVVVFARASRMTEARRARALRGWASPLQDLCIDVDPDYDHVRGAADATVTLVEYGDLECPYCGRAESVVRELLADSDPRYVWRHLPLTDVHPHAQLAAEASEGAGGQGRFWEMHDRLLEHQDRLAPPDLWSTLGVWTSTWTASVRTWSTTVTPRASRATRSRPTCPAWPGHRPSSSTAGGTTARTTSPHCRRRSPTPGHEP